MTASPKTAPRKVRDDPVEFAETFAQAYGGKRWIDKERARLIEAIDDAKRGERQ